MSGYLLLLKTSYNTLQILNFDWLAGKLVYELIYHNMLGVYVFFTMIVADFEVFLLLFSNKTIIPPTLVGYEIVIANSTLCVSLATI